MRTRETLALTGTLLPLVIGGCRPARTTPESTVTSAISPEILARTPEAQLQSTVQALQASGERTSFVPEGAFTDALYEKVILASFPIGVYFSDAASGGSCFVLKKEGNSLYLLTAAHVIEQEDSSEIPWKISLFLPWYGKLDVTTIQVVKSTNRDIALIRATFPAHTGSMYAARRIVPLQFQDDYPLKSGDRVLVVGWPDEFRDLGLTAASVMTVHFGDVHWWANGLVNYGASGSVVVVPDTEGNPMAVGIIIGMNDAIDYPDNHLTVTRMVAGHSLEVNHLMQQLPVGIDN